jgi:hypothetical protein
MKLWIDGKNGAKLERNPERIPEVLEALRVAWEKNPELRLGQLIRNVSYPQETVLIEDDKIMDCFQNSETLRH